MSGPGVPDEADAWPVGLSRAEIIACQSEAPTAVERRRWQVIGMLLDDYSVEQIAAATSYRPRTIRRLAARYRSEGASALRDGRTSNSGQPHLLSAPQQQQLSLALRGPPPEGERWTGPLVARWIAAATGRTTHRQRGWEYLRRLRKL